MKQLQALAFSLFVVACSGGPEVLRGTRADGLAVDCAPTSTSAGDDIYECTPDDGDNTCESFEDGGPAMVLWPPNHKLVTISLEECAALDDGCDDDGGGDGGGGDGGGDGGGGGDGADDGGGGGAGLLPLGKQALLDATITAITADEAVDVGHGGDGATKNYDMRLVDATTVEVRSERQGGGDGRVYRVHYLTAAGDVGSCEIHVPHDQGPFGGAVDSGEVVRVEP